MKNRLAEIKHLHEYIKIAHEDDDGNNFVQTLVELFAENHIKWLIEQAEKVERYEKALKRISDEPINIKSDSGNDWLDISVHYEKIAEKALKD